MILGPGAIGRSRHCRGPADGSRARPRRAFLSLLRHGVAAMRRQRHARNRAFRSTGCRGPTGRWPFIGPARPAHAGQADLAHRNRRSGLRRQSLGRVFLDTFRYLDQLGRLAKGGVQVVMHNTLAASDYGLLDERTLEPRPNYWGALLWRRLMGRAVLDAGLPVQWASMSTPTANAARRAASSLLVINNDRTRVARAGACQSTSIATARRRRSERTRRQV